MALTNTTRMWHTVNLNLLIFVMGTAIAMYGTTVLDLAEMYSTNTEAIAYTLTTRSFGSIFAGLTGGLLFKHINTQLVCIACMTGACVACVLMPILAHIRLLHVLSFIIGMLLAYLEIGSHVWLQMMWKKKCGSVLQFFNFSFGLGGIVSPFIAEPFLSKNVPLSLTQEDAIFNKTSNIITPVASTSRIYIPYAIMGGAYFVIAVSMILCYLKDSDNYRPNDDENEDKNNSQSNLPNNLRLFLITLLCAYMSVGVANEVTFASMISVFVVANKNLSFTKSQGAYLSSVFWIAFTASRLVSTLLSLKLSPNQLFLVFHVIYITASAVLLFFANSSPIIIWIGTGLFSFGLSPYYANACAWGIQFLILDHSIMSVIMVSICLAIMAPTMLVGQSIEETPMVLMHANMGFAIGLTILATCLAFYGNFLRKRNYALMKT